MELVSIVLYLMLTFTLIQAFLSLVRGSKTCRKLPPGPATLPVVGNLLKLGNKPHKSLAELAKTHGPIMSLKLGQITTVVISSSTMAKEVLQKQDLVLLQPILPQLSSRPSPRPILDGLAARCRAVAQPPKNHELQYVFGLDANQSLRRQKVQELISYVGKCCQEGVAVDIGRAAFTTSLNLLSNTVFSVDLADPSQDSAKEFRDLVWNIMVEAGKPNLVDYFPVLAKIDPQGIRGRMRVHFAKILQLFGRLIDERLELRKLRKTSEENDVLDILLDIIDQNSEDIDRIHMEHLFLDVFAAGTDTTSSTVEWAMAELLRNPETLNRAKAELEQAIGKGKPIEESGVSHLPYLQAIVKETLRIHPPVPFLIPRKVESDVEVRGYIVPQGTQVLVNVWAIGRDPNIWLNPTSFMPERFLGLEIDVRGRDFELIPFGAGRRICPGLPLAIRMIPVMLGSLINSFDWKLEGGIAPKDLDMEDKFGITLQKAQPLCVVPIPM
ncbi:hypothetical protein HYC85_005428 [Camellia sinensis]|uniref:Geraniol 10-hydroxylase n=1 Tax=Camellia sinensis TaxID=4442 RepID=A0A7J7HZH4_CAMSI|nr:hypothetical protein HYC85_005428 [Camellia sinensis]